MKKISLPIALSLALYKRAARHRNVFAFIFLIWSIPFNLLAFGPVFVITPDTIDFGVLAVGEDTFGILHVSNIGDGTGQISLGSITGLAFQQWPHPGQ